MPNLELTVASGQPLSIRRFSVDEAVSSLFNASVWATSIDPDVDLEGIIGKDASLLVESVVGILDGVATRSWKGVCTHVEQVHGVAPIPGQIAESSYFLRIAPRAWLLTQRHNYRIYQHLSIPDILDKLLGEWSISPAWNIDRGKYPKLEYKVQYGESDYVFLSRLAEEAGLAFVFPDDAGSNITFYDELQTGPKRAGLPIPYAEEVTFAPVAFVTNVRLSHDVRPGAHTIRDYDFRRPSFPLLGQATPAPAPENRYEQYRYQPNSMLIEGKPEGGTPVADDQGTARSDQTYGAARAERANQGQRVGRRQVAFESNTPDSPPAIASTSRSTPTRKSRRAPTC